VLSNGINELVEIMNVSLGTAWEGYVAERVNSGEFNNASEVVRDALRRQQEQLLKLEALRREVQAGSASLDAGRVVKTTAEDVIRRTKLQKR
jgi:antitoxin ParD1/3/4